MTRVRDPHLTNLLLGHPSFLQDYWKNHEIPPGTINASLESGRVWEMDYWNRKSLLSPSLEKAILQIHQTLKNAETEDRHIVVGCGATQLISAAAFALVKRGVRSFHSTAPYWPRFPDLTKIGAIGEKVTWSSHSTEGCQIITTPSNPTNAIAQKSGSPQGWAIYDLCYNWPQYSAPIHWDEDIMIFSLAKATGHASTRIGWALVKDEKLAWDMRRYIDLSTTGVSVHSEEVAAYILSSQAERDFDQSCFHFGKTRLENRWKRLQNSALFRCDEIEILNRNGMFLWGKTGNPETVATQFLKDRFQIRSLDGKACGSTSDYFRINLGCPESEFEWLESIE